MSYLDDLLGKSGMGPDPNLERIANAVELSAALQARFFFTHEQEGAENAIKKLDLLIQKRASKLCSE